MNPMVIEAGAATEAAPPDGVWSWRRRWLWIVVVLVVHLGLIFVLGDRKRLKPRPPAPALAATWVTDASKLPPMENPILFALPHAKGFAGSALVKIPALDLPPFRWTEPARFLPLPVETLGTAFDQFAQEFAGAPFQFEVKPPALLAIPFVPEIKAEVRTRSTLRIVGEPVPRRLLNPPELPSQPAGADLLTNTVVQAVVGADGLVESIVQLKRPPGSGSEKADRDALDYARGARFAPLPIGAEAPTIVRMIFEWHVAPTNSPAVNR